MEPLKGQALRLAENLTLPAVQVVVMRADMSCNHCQKRVSDMVSKMNGITDYVVDVNKKEVIVRSTMNMKRRKKKSRKTLPSVLALFRPICCNPPPDVALTKI